MIEQTYSDIVTPELLAGAIENNEYEGFREDYHVLHCLVRKYKPKTFCEVGTNMGTGTNIICNAVYSYLGEEKSVVFPCGQTWAVCSLDLPTELAHISLQHPISEGKGDKVGERCKFPFAQLRGDSLNFDFTEYPCEGYFIDGEHDYIHPYRESGFALMMGAKIVIWHDADITDVRRAINDVFKDNQLFRDNYQLFRVTDTRIAYALRK